MIEFSGLSAYAIVVALLLLLSVAHRAKREEGRLRKALQDAEDEALRAKWRRRSAPGTMTEEELQQLLEASAPLGVHIDYRRRYSPDCEPGSLVIEVTSYGESK